MKFLPIIVLSTAAGAFARGGGGDSDAEAEDYMGMSYENGMGGGGRWRNSTNTDSSPKSQCRQLAQLTALANLASNPTKLSEITAQIESQDPSQAASFQAQVSQASSQLSALQQSNATLVQTCAPVLAEMEMRQACRAMAQMEKLASLVADPTKLAAKTDNYTGKIEKIRQMVASSAKDLPALQGNSTLTQFCSVLDTRDDCWKMKRLERMLQKNGNGTASGEGWGSRREGGGGGGDGERKGRHRGNETATATSTEAGGDGNGNGEDAAERAQKWQAKLAEKKAELEELKSNTTLVQMCAAMDCELFFFPPGSSFPILLPHCLEEKN